MRITHNSIYNVAQTRLGSLVEEYSEANRVVTTGKRINRISDDPVGISSVVDLRSRLANLDQLADNINTASTWLTASETTLRSVEEVVADAKVLALSMRSGLVSGTDRANASVQIQEALTQVLDLANSQVNGQYIFSGTRTDTRPFAFDDPDNPTAAAIYSGNAGAFTLKTGKDAAMAVGYDGSDIFGSQTLMVDSSNNRIDFMEDVGGGFGAEITATIANGTFTKAELAVEIQNALNNASSASGNSINYQVAYDDATGNYTIQDDGAIPGSEVRFLWGSGTNAGQSIAPDIGFDVANQESPPLIESDSPADWGLFKTLIDFRDALLNNDIGGIDRAMNRLDTQFENIVTAVSQIGFRGVSLDAKTTVIEDLNLTYMAQKAEIEEADLIEAITTLQAKQNAYQAALASTSKIMQISLLDYL